MNINLLARAFLIGLAATAGLASAQTRPAQRQRATPPARDPHAEGFVEAKDLPDGENAPADVNGNFILGPTHKRAAELPAKDGVSHGKIFDFTMDSVDSKFYPGIARDNGTMGTPDPKDQSNLIVTTSRAHPYSRKVGVYVPADYVAGTDAPFIVGADGPDRLLMTVVDTLVSQHKIPPIVVVSIANGSGDAQGSERGLEYDTMSGKYAEFVEAEVLPRVEKEANVKLTKDPEGRATTGCSSGASCAIIMAWYHPEWYHRVMSYSGTFVNQQWPHDPDHPQGAWALHDGLIQKSEAKPIRIWMEVGDKDLLNPNAMRDNMHDWVVANERTAKALADKGYHYQFVFAKNAGHCDGKTKEQTMVEALEYLWKDYKPAGK